jgi:hypothetical protein
MSETPMKTYRLAPSGRRTAIVLLISALIIWVFALWTFRSTLDIRYLDLWNTLRAAFEKGFSISQIVPALLMLVLIVATPLVVWNLLEEWAASYTPTDEGLRFESLGVRLTYPWAGISAIRRPDDDAEDPLDELMLADDYTRQIGNPLLRFLHRQAYGRRRLPIYAGLEQRDELLALIGERAGIGAPLAPVPAQENAL